MMDLKIGGTAALVFAATLAMGSPRAALAQNGDGSTNGNAKPSSDPNVSQPAASATGKPLEMQSREGFWGHMNPLARKKWVARQVNPIRERANELDELQAKNANDIRDVDTRATAGVSRAMAAANAADAHAADAAGRADRANALALSADGRTTSLNGTVANLDQYQTVSSTALPFAQGRTALGTRAKSELDTIAGALANEKGYIVEVQGYSRSGTQPSQAMADSVVRYLVTAHQVPVYRIYRTGLGNSKQTSEDGSKPLANGVRVTVLHNSLSTLTPAQTPGS